MTQKYIPERLKNKSYGPRKLSLTSPHSHIPNMMETSGFLELEYAVTPSYERAEVRVGHILGVGRVQRCDNLALLLWCWMCN